MLIPMCVPLAFSLLNRFTHNPPLEAPLIYIPSLAFVGCRWFTPYLIVAGAGNGTRTRTRTELTSWDFKSQVSTKFHHPRILPHSEAFARLTMGAQNDKVSTLDNQVVRKTLLQRID